MFAIRHTSDERTEERRILVLLFAIIVVAVLMNMIPGIAYAVHYYAYGGVDINHYLKKVRGELNVKFNRVDHLQRDFMVYLNWFAEDSSVGAGHFIGRDLSGTVKYCSQIYHKIGTGNPTYDLADCEIPLGYRYLASVEETSNGSKCFEAVTYGLFRQTYCFNRSNADIAGFIANAWINYSSEDTMSGKFDHLQTAYWSNVQNKYLFRYFTDDETTQWKCYSTNGVLANSWVEDHLMHRAPDGNPLNMFDDVGIGPTAFTQDDCSMEQDVWAPRGVP